MLLPLRLDMVLGLLDVKAVGLHRRILGLVPPSDRVVEVL